MNCEYHMTKATSILQCLVCVVSGRDTEQSNGIMEANRLISAGEVIALNLIFSRITFRPWPAHSRSLCYNQDPAVYIRTCHGAGSKMKFSSQML